MLINVMLVKKYVNIKSKNLTHFEFSRLATMINGGPNVRKGRKSTIINGKIYLDL